MKHNGLFSRSAIVKHYTSNAEDCCREKITGEENAAFRAGVLKVRSSFSALCEKSYIAAIPERLYLSLLACPLSVLGTFLAVFSIISPMLNLFIYGAAKDFFIDGRNLSAMLIFIIALTFLPVKKNISQLVSKSLFLSKFEISYDSKILKASRKGEKVNFSYSTAVFLGMLCGIFSALFSPVSVLFFMTLLVCSLIIFNRPECGILTISFVLPLLENRYVIFAAAMTAFSFLYKYLRCKRHFYFGRDEQLLFCCGIIFFVSGIFTKSGVISITDSLKFVSVIVIYLCVKNLIKSISLFNGCIKLISTSSAIISILLLLFHVLSLAAPFIKFGFLDGTRLALSLSNVISADNHLIAVIAITLPLNFAQLLGRDRQGSRIKHGIAFIAQLCCITLYTDKGVILPCLISMVIVLAFKYFKSLLLLPFTPFASQLLIKVSDFLSAAPLFETKEAVFSESAHSIITNAVADNLLIGIGIGSQNFTDVISSYAVPGSSSLLHPYTSITSLTLSFGVPASLFLIVTVGHLISKNLRFAVINKGKNELCDTASAGLFASCVCCSLLFFTVFFTANACVMALFAVILGLGYCMDDCVNADFIDNNRLR